MVAEAAELDLIPRSVRDKLDRVGIKLHLKEWQQLSLAERRQLCDSACDSPLQIEAYRHQLEEMVHRHTGRLPQPLTAKRAG